ncbi:MAG TPA: SelB C-terminal domain-containing protein [Polyangiaceae bacterium]|nr:SelB C-terminal domain-containing protein [Polyangiaceae bacterium]
MSAPSSDGAGAQETLDGIRALLVRQERDAPWALGLTLLGLSKRLRIAESALHPLLRSFVEEGRIVFRSGYYATPGFAPDLSEEQRIFFAQHLPDARSANAPVSVAEVAAEMKASKITGIAQAFDTLVEIGAIVQIGADLYRYAQIERLQHQVARALAQRPRMTVAELRDLIGISRKHVVPLLEWFDRIGLTVREGDYRLASTITIPENAPLTPD